MKKLILIVTAIVLMSACGGGSGDSSPVGDPPPPPPPPSTVSLQISGTISSPDLPNALITATVAGRSFETSSDELGNYSLEIEINESEQTSLLVIDAFGTGSLSHIHYKTYVDSIQSLLTIGNQLNDSDVPSLRVSQIKTALSAVLRHEGEITDLDSLALARQEYDRDLVLPFATTLVYFTDLVDGQMFDLPDGIETTWELLSDKETALDMARVLAERNPPAAQGETSEFNEVTQSLVTNSELVGSAESLNLPTNFYFIGLGDSNGDGKIELLEDGSGSLTFSGTEYPATWDLQDQLLNLQLDGAAFRVFLSGNICEGYIRTANIGFIDDAADSTLLSLLLTREVICEDEPSLNYTSRTVQAYEVVDERVVADPEWLTEGEYVLLSPDVVISHITPESPQAVLNFSYLTRVIVSEGNGFVLRRAIDFTVDNELIYKEYQGTFSSDQKQLILPLEDGETFSFNIARPISNELALSSISATQIAISNDESEPDAEVDPDAKTLVQKSGFIVQKDEQNFTDNSIVGWYESRNVSWFKTQTTWYEYREDGTAYTYSWIDQNDDHQIQEASNTGQSEISIFKRYWRLNDGGDVEEKVYLPIFRGNDDACASATFDSFPEQDCYLRQTSVISRINSIDDKLLIDWQYSRFRFTGISTITELNAVEPEMLKRLEAKPTLIEEAGL
ncbi:hypothetical protein [Brumicola blandensis]|uniref:Carboxypeptidase regulatory-like domain-containing protein n=1 Tax=Brumicola blandensis TaxID=3075611 RepID=A0AAW8QY72_9ALTE|nr:hypothetical protein [Alteromonas sp. W409]MDT0582108.1 hypothetical protein [Alteromonas sp. W409]